ncbi:MAG: enoyl-CoA hydratase/isomerase family protein [Chromatiales bacterium]|jgi:enoyl-CoA hydratase/carnithine racemase|nr:enoyl-CoA hydratase/isomerase family protein [Chromatiales bacterium]
MTDADADLVGYESDGPIVWLTLNRPEKLNAFSDELVVALRDRMRQFDADSDAQIAILHGSGRAFSTGADVNQRQLRSREEFERLGGPQGFGANSGELFVQSVNWKPVITAVHGYVLGLSTGIMFESDLIVAEAGTQIQITETSRGLGGAKYWGLTQFRGGGAFGTEVALTGRFFSAEEAFAADMINRVAPKGEYLAQAKALALEVCANPPLSVRATVRTRRWYMQRQNAEINMQTQPLKLYLTEDFHEAASAFTQKRKPNPFKGR